MPGVTCQNCLSGHVKDGKPSGIVATIHGFSTYVARPEGTPKGLVVLIPDVFGWELSNCRLLADAYAKEGGLLVYLPNFMNGESPQPILHHSESLI
jgi:dienelactone hydrolase